MLKNFLKSFWGISILSVNTNFFFFDFDNWFFGTLRTLHVTAEVYAGYLANTSGACVHFRYLAYTCGVRVLFCVHFGCTRTLRVYTVCTLHCDVEKNFEVFWVSAFAGQHKLFFFNFGKLVFGTLRALHVNAEVYAGYLAYTSGACVQFRYLAYTFSARVHSCIHFCVHFRCTQCVHSTVVVEKKFLSFWVSAFAGQLNWILPWTQPNPALEEVPPSPVIINQRGYHPIRPSANVVPYCRTSAIF